MQKVIESIKNWIKENSLVLLYFLFAVLVEMTAVFTVEGSPFLSRPFMSLGLLVFVCGIALLIKNNLVRLIFCAVMLIGQGVLDLVFAVIYNMTDQYFDLGMLNLRNDAFGILENIPVDFVTFYAGLFFSVMFIVYGMRVSYARLHIRSHKKSPFFYAGLMLAGIATLGISFATYYPRTSTDKYDEMIDGKAQSAYSAYGMIGNLLGEFGNAVFQDRTPIDGNLIDKFIYEKTSTPTKYYGVAEGKNVLTVLCESLEWYTFLRGNTEASGILQGEYPMALDIPQETLAYLYPNLTEYYNESVVMTNFHSREKTDISETISIMGSYPTGAYVNYEFSENTLPYTLPNILKSATSGEISSRSFHNGFKTFYNRHKAHPMLGFEELTDMYDMEKMSNEIEKNGGEEIFYNYMDEGERNLDSEMVETAKDLMFPTNERFYSYITTITMHGMYYDRANLRGENNLNIAERLTTLQEYMPKEEDFEDFESAESLYYYMTTGLELDHMLGCIKRELQSRKDEKTGQPLWDNTVIVLFGDHNAYYQQMSNYVKDIPDYDAENKFTDLYNVPLMIRDKDLTANMSEEERIIEKFTCTADIVPTLFDLLGINYYTNLYYGHSVFSDEQSVLYSRAYDNFIGDGILRRSVKGDLYLYDGLTETGVPVKDTVSAWEKEATALVERIKYCDYIFRQDHFGNRTNYQKFQEKMREINP